MRLIDADEMIKRLQAWNTKDSMDKALYSFALSRILEQPTAYDMDEVMEQLNDKRENLDFAKATIEEVKAYINGINDAVEIVKERGQDKKSQKYRYMQEMRAYSLKYDLGSFCRDKK